MATDLDPNVVTEYERETWSRCADSYLDTFAELTKETVPLLVRAARIEAGAGVLELGSGPGHVSGALAEAGAKVTGIDFSQDMVAVAARRYPSIEFRQADAEELPFGDETFDAVVSNFVVHHLARPENVFREVCRVLKPKGRFAFVVWGAPEAQSSIGAFFGAVTAHHDLDELPHGPLFGVTERAVYEPLVTKGGLSKLELDTHQVHWRADSIEPILKGFWDWGNMSALPQHVQEKIEATTIDNARAYEKDGRYVFPHEVLLGVAEKR